MSEKKDWDAPTGAKPTDFDDKESSQQKGKTEANQQSQKGMPPLPGEKKNIVDEIKNAPQDEQIAYGCITIGVFLVLVSLLLFLIL